MSDYLPLPAQVADICRSVQAPPRLVAHLTLVHDVAFKLTGQLTASFPALAFDRDLVLFGAATHDIGKAIYPSELSGPGSMHEEHGADILKKFGVRDEQSRFTRTHAQWNTTTVDIEDLLVALADKCWKGKRDTELEEKTVQLIAKNTGQEAWEIFSILDDILQKLAADADERLTWQAQFSVEN